MKTRDLMQGDKVYETLLDDTPQVVTVEEVGQNHIYIGMEDDDMALLRYEPEHLGWNIKHIEPIPLTKEMLVNDEFYIAEEASHNAVLKKKTDDALIVVRLIGNSFVLNIERNIEFEGTYATDSVHKCGHFAHEYQQALRLCGLNNLANNFKALTADGVSTPPSAPNK